MIRRRLGLQSSCRSFSGPSAVGLLIVAWGGLFLTGCAGLQQDGGAGARGVGQKADKAAAYQLEQADVFLEQGLSDSALAAFGMALESNPRLVQAHLGMGHIYRKRGDLEFARRAFERATVVGPTSFDAHYYLGLMRQLLGQLPEAVRSYLQALAIAPGSFDANKNLAAAYLQLGRAGEALPYAKQAAAINPEDPGAAANLASIFSMLGRYEEAIDTYRAALELGQPAQPVLLGLADAHLRLGHYALAVNTLRETVRRTPSVMAYERLGYAYFKQRQFSQSLDAYRQAVALDGADTASLNGVGAVLMTLYVQAARPTPAMRDEALGAWRKSLQLRPEQPRIIELVSRYQSR